MQNYIPEPIERKQVYGVTFEQGRNELKIDEGSTVKLLLQRTRIFQSRLRSI